MPQIQVRVKDIGDGQFVYYDDKRRRPGEVFFVKDESHISKKTMERVDEHPEPTKSPAKQLTGDPKTRQPAVRRSAHVRATDDKSTQGNDIAKSADTIPAGNAGGEGEVI